MRLLSKYQNMRPGLYFYGYAYLTSIRSSRFYITIIKKILVQHGHNPDLVQIVTGFAATGVALINSGVDKVASHLLVAAWNSLE